MIRYVRSGGSNTAPYDTWAKAALLPSTAIAASAPGDTVEIAGGTYTETGQTTLPAGQADAYITIKKTTDPELTGRVLIKRLNIGHPRSIYYGTSGYHSWQGITFENHDTGPDLYYVLSDKAHIIVCEDLEFQGLYDCFAMYNEGNASSHAILRRCFFRGGTKNGSYGPRIFGPAPAPTVRYEYCVFSRPDPDYTLGAYEVRTPRPPEISNNVTGYFYNCLFDGFGEISSIKVNSAANKLRVKNCFWTDPLTNATYLVQNSGGITDIEWDYNVYNLHNGGRGTNVVAGPHDIDMYTLAQNPQRTGYGYNVGLHTWTSDDTRSGGALGHGAYASILEEYGYRLTWYVNAKHVEYVAGAEALMNDLHTRGHEIASHCYTHEPMDRTYGFDIIGPDANSTIAIDRTADTITLHDNSGDLVITGMKTKMLYDLAAEIKARSGWDCRHYGEDEAPTYGWWYGRGCLPGEVYNDLPATSCSTWLSIPYLLDTACVAGFRYVQLKMGKDLIENYIDDEEYECVSWSAPNYSAYTDDFTALRNAGFKYARSTTDASRTKKLEHIDLIRTTTGDLPILNLNLDELPNKRAALFRTINTISGGFFNICYAHGIGYGSDWYPEQLRFACDVLKQFSDAGLLRVDTHKGNAGYIESSGLWTADGNYWNRTLTTIDKRDNGYPRISSAPGVNAGIDLGIEGPDFLGNSIIGNVDIGACERQMLLPEVLTINPGAKISVIDFIPLISPAPEIEVAVVGDHAALLKRLFPTEIGGVFDDDFAVEGRTLDAVQASAEDLLKEFFADLTYHLIARWEMTYGLTPLDDPLQVRRAALIQRLRELGGLSREYFINLAATYGMTITIDEFQPFMAGWNRAGDHLNIPESIWIWQVNAAGDPTFNFRAGQSCAGERLNWWRNEFLESIFQELKPAHTILYFNYGS